MPDLVYSFTPAREAGLTAGGDMVLPRTLRTRTGLLFDFADGGFPSAYLGSVAAGGVLLPTAFEAPNKQSMTRGKCIARDNITSIALVLPNYYVASTSAPTDGTERAPNGGTAAATVRASIEYPSGTFTQVLFSGSPAGSIPAGGTLVSDLASVAIPYGEAFWWRVHFSNADGRLYSLLYPFQTGDGIIVGVTTPDITMGGTVTQTASQMYTPAAIIGYTRRSSVLMLGDSRVAGRADTGDASNNFGSLGRSIGTTLATINAGCTGDRALWAKANFTQRVKLVPYASHIICQYGINDLNASAQTPAQTVASLATLYALLGGKPIWQTTVPPITTSSDSWATVANQTVNADDADRVTFNNLVRAGVAGTQGFFDQADVAESARDSGKWKAPGWTSDGAHELKLGNLAYQAAGIINPGIFQR